MSDLVPSFTQSNKKTVSARHTRTIWMHKNKCAIPYYEILLIKHKRRLKRKTAFTWLIHLCSLTLIGRYVHIFITCVYKYIWCKYSARITSCTYLGSFESITRFSGQWCCSFYLYNSDEDFQLIYMQLQVHTVCQPGAQEIHCAGVPLLKYKYIVLQQRQTHI